MAAIDLLRATERFYAALMQHSGSTEGLGGSLLYAGSLDVSTRALIAAANIAGAASLAAAPDAETQRLAVREGIADFLVTSLDEALRILKNEIRKHAAVSVCVSVEATVLEAEMQERGVAPDLIALGVARVFALAQIVEAIPVREPLVRLEWQVSTAPALWMPKLDEIARACLMQEDAAGHRWLRLAPRYCGRVAAGMRVLRCTEATARDFSDRVGSAIRAGEIGVPVEIRTTAD